MKSIICSYDSDKERVTIRADDKVIGILSEINIDSVAFVIQTATAMYQEIKNKNSIEYEKIILQNN
jgi:hypothetical protein